MAANNSVDTHQTTNGTGYNATCCPLSEEDDEEEVFLPAEPINNNSNASADDGGPYGLWLESRWNGDITPYLWLIGMGGLLMGMVLMGIFLLPVYFGRCRQTATTQTSPVNTADQESRRLLNSSSRTEQESHLVSMAMVDLSWREADEIRRRKEEEKEAAKQAKQRKEEANIIQQRAERSVRRKSEGSSTKWRYTAVPPAPETEPELSLIHI